MLDIIIMQYSATLRFRCYSLFGLLYVRYQRTLQGTSQGRSRERRRDVAGTVAVE